MRKAYKIQCKFYMTQKASYGNYTQAVLYQFVQRDAIDIKYLNCVKKLEENQNYFNKICLYGILSVSTSHPDNIIFFLIQGGHLPCGGLGSKKRATSEHPFLYLLFFNSKHSLCQSNIFGDGIFCHPSMGKDKSPVDMNISNFGFNRETCQPAPSHPNRPFDSWI